MCSITEGLVLCVAGSFKLAEQFAYNALYRSNLRHSGWDRRCYFKDVGPEGRYFCYFEWFYHAHGSAQILTPAEPFKC